MATAAAKIANATTESLDSSELLKNVARISQSATVPLDSGNGSSDDQSNRVNGVDAIIDSLTPTMMPLDGSTPAASEKPAESQADIDSRSKETENSLLDLLTNASEKLYENTLRGAFPHRLYERLLAEEAEIPLHRRIKNVKNLSFVFHAYLRLMEHRISVLENRKGLDQSEENEEQEQDTEVSVPKVITSLRRIKWPEFKRKHDEKRNVNEEHAIDVLVGDPVIPHDVWRNAHIRKNPLCSTDRRRYTALQLFADIQDMPELAGQTDTKMLGTKPHEIPSQISPPIPHRIRINGEPLRQLLEKALDVDFDSSGCPVVFLRPFKLLVHYEDRIRQIHGQLERKFSSVDCHEGKLFPKDDGENRDFLDQYGTEQAYKELGCLVEFMDHDLKSLTQFRDVTRTKTGFSDLWHIFYPGREVITSQEPMNAYRIFHVTGGRPYLSPPEDEEYGEIADYTKPYRVPAKESDLVVTCYQIDFDGKKFGPVTHSFRIQKFDDFRDITTLPIYPLEFAKKQERIQRKLNSNGDTFRRICQGGHVQYRGMNLHEAEEIDSEVVVDFQAALWDPQDKDKDNGWDYSIEFGIKPTSSNRAEVIMISDAGCRSAHCCDNEVVFDDSIIDHRRMEEFLMDKTWLTTDPRYLNDKPNRLPPADLHLFPHRLFAFVLKDRKWAVIDINNVKDMPDPRPNAWTSLVLPEGHKEMVYSIVQAHFRDNSSRPDDEMQADLIRGKGKGLIILLHGAPGTGKTSTAECVAELCKRPLYPITCGDLGTTAVEVESRLKRIFIQAQKWKCVLLLDEADVFLSERGIDVKHNSLVSGNDDPKKILPIEGMDEAFRSRVHVSLYYPPLTKKSTIDVFETNLERIKVQRGDLLRVKEDEIRNFAQTHYEQNRRHARWNGRQIRNAFHIAVALAENEAKVTTGKEERRKSPQPTLRKKHFRMVEGASTKFDDYLTEVLGGSHSAWAKHKTNRKDTWKEKRYSRERSSTRHDRNKGARRRTAVESDDITSDSSDSQEDEDEDEERSDGNDSSEENGGSKREDGDETKSSDDDDDKGNYPRDKRGTEKKRSIGRGADSRTKGRSKKSSR
ncbi:hypothetical protein CCMA1212_005738 [Trichoderma ghanense]|uniref:AAA+ ATPase domain-containing protein n=1 Tax=Trichoderma ghanense TaxID=65468 RepID=A0ABY2H3Y1_9HYPO